jgi:UbiD family decarboxylase
VAQKGRASLRDCIEFLKEIDGLITVTEEVNPELEIASISKGLDNGPAFLFEKIKGYPEARVVTNIFARREMYAKIFGVDDPKKLKWKCLEALRKPLPPKVVTDAPCQEVVITKGINVPATLPIMKHTPEDGARVMGSGNALLSGKYFRGGTEISFKRMHFRGNDWGTFRAVPTGTHFGQAMWTYYRNENIPVTVNIGNPPAVTLMAGAGGVHAVVPYGSDELGIAGALQGTPIEIVKAKTVDAYAVAQAEWVIEGYITPEEYPETEETARIKQYDVAPLFPEWRGTFGKTRKARKFQVTAVTHRKDNPIYPGFCADSFEGEHVGMDFREAAFFELCERLYPGLVVDVNILDCLKIWGGLVLQVRKQEPRDEEYLRNLLVHVLISPGTRLAVACDEDTDIYCADEVLWAIMVRVDPSRQIVPDPRQVAFTAEELAKGEIEYRRGGLAIDATKPFVGGEIFRRPHYAVDEIDYRKWFTQEQINNIRSKQSEYARILASKGT